MVRLNEKLYMMLASELMLSPSAEVLEFDYEVGGVEYCVVFNCDTLQLWLLGVDGSFVAHDFSIGRLRTCC